MTIDFREHRSPQKNGALARTMHRSHCSNTAILNAPTAQWPGRY
jgi:hypothetical protein